MLYSHRSGVPAFVRRGDFPTACNISLEDNVAFISPMFHAMSWGMPYCAPAMGSKLVMPGQKVDGESLHKLFEQEGRSHSPTACRRCGSATCNTCRHAGVKPTTLKRVLMGGTACPRSLMATLEDDYGVRGAASCGA